MSDELVLEIDPPYIGSAVSPTVDITETQTDVTVTITDFRGEHSYSVDKTDQAIADAEQAATNANTAAANATSTANQAAQYARDTADQAAADAQATADEAAGRADTAAGGATQAAQAATTAAGTANTAASNADAKAALADSKAALADQAATTANTAAQAAEAAKTAANTAAGQATTAAGNATTAAGQATTAATNADAKAQLADTAATNADTATQAANTAATNATNAAQAANNAADVAIEAAEDMPRLVGTVDTAQAVADAWPTTIESATVYGKCVQDGTPTPDNPVPVQVVGGRNLIKPSVRTVTADGVTYSVTNDGKVTLTGTATADNRFSLVTGTDAQTIAAGTYTLSKTGGASKINFNGVAQANAITRTFTSPFNTNGTSIVIESGVTYNDEFYVQLEVGTQATPYTPIGCISLQTGETVTPIDLQGHTLAGLRNDVRDELTINAAGVKRIGQRVGVVDLGTLDWLYQSTQDFMYARIYPDQVPSPKPGSSTISGAYITRAYFTDDGLYLRMFGTGYTDAETFKTSMSGVMLYYELATPQTIELGTITPPEISPGDTLAIYASLDPQWAIEYTQDPNLVVHSLQSSIAPVEGATASTNYAVGAYLMHGNQLYRVTSAIATGEAIAPGSNCVACTVMGEVIRLTA